MAEAITGLTMSSCAEAASTTVMIFKKTVELPPRKFKAEEYYQYKHLHGMPKFIPKITILHYAAVVLPVILLLVVFARHREQAAQDLADERSKTKSIRRLLMGGAVFASLVVACHMRLIPVRYVRRVFPNWKQPPPMSKFMKGLICFFFVAFIIYPTVKFIRKRNIPPPSPQIHKLLKDRK